MSATAAPACGLANSSAWGGDYDRPQVAIIIGLEWRLPPAYAPFKDGTPAHDPLGDILATLDADQFQSCFVGWAQRSQGFPRG